MLRRPNENQDAKQPPKFERNYEKIKSYGLVKTKTRQNFLSSQPEAEYVFVWTEKLRKLFVLQLSVRMIIEITFLVLYFMIQAEQHNEKLTVRKKQVALHLVYEVLLSKAFRTLRPYGKFGEFHTHILVHMAKTKAHPV